VQYLAQILMTGSVTADAVAGEKCLSAKQGVAGAFKVHPFRQVFDYKAIFGKPGIEEGRLAGPNLMAKSGAEKSPAEYKPGVGREHQVGQPGLRGHQLDLYAKLHKGIVKVPPLHVRPLRGTAARPAHPRVDLILNPVIIRRAHQDTWLRTHHSLLITDSLMR